MVADTELRTLLTGGADFLLKSIWSRNSSVSVVNRPREGPLGLPTLFFSGCCGRFALGKWPCHEASQSPSSSTEVRNEWS